MALRERVLDLVRNECDRQIQLKAEGRFKNTCSDKELTNQEKLVILVEEVGEVARAILEKHGLANDKHNADLNKELVQVAAVCVSWLVSFEELSC